MKRSVLFALLALSVAPLLSVAPACAEDAPPATAPGRIPLDFPAVGTSAQAGEHVLAPPKLWLDKAFAEGIDKQTFIFYTATMVEPGPLESKVKTPFDEYMMANSLIVPIPKGGTAKPGDVVLTWWQSGSGMQRAIVIDGGTDTAPQVLYLDISLSNPTGAAKKPETLKPDSFVKLSEPWSPGSALAVKDKTWGWILARVLAVAEEKVLLIGWAGKMSVAAKDQCVPLPVSPAGLNPGDAVMAPRMNAMKQGKVNSIDAAAGRVFVGFTIGGKEVEEGVPFGNLIPALP